MIKRLGTVRAVTTAVATLFVAIALVAGATALIAVLRQTLIDEMEEAARLQALDVAHQLEAGRLPDLEVAGSQDEQLIQLITPAGAVVASSPNISGKPAVVRLAPGQSMRLVTPLDDDEFIAVAEAANTPDGLRIVVVARALIGVLETTTVVTQLLIVGLPVLLVVVARHDLVRGGSGTRSSRARSGGRSTKSRPLNCTAGFRSRKPTTRLAGLRPP